MPLQNRVNPFGEIFSTSARGAWMGNRGCLHDASRQLLKRRWTRKAWVTCCLEYEGVRRKLMAPGQYTELFFLDEATALAAGHRPCASCRRESYNEFKSSWITGNPEASGWSSIRAIDDVLHAERVDPLTKAQRTWCSPPSALPDGAFLRHPNSDSPWLVWNSELRRWAESGYADTRPIEDSMPATVLTPRSICNALRVGYRPQVAVSIELAGVA